MTFNDTEMKWSHGFRGGAIRKLLLTLRWKICFLLEISVNLVIKIKMCRLCQPTIRYLKKVIILLENTFIYFKCMKTLKKLFELGPMESFRSPRNLRSYLLRAKLYPMERKIRSSKCKSNRRQVCLNISEMEVFASNPCVI